MGTPTTEADSRTSIYSNVFAHEIGHAFGLAADPFGYQKLAYAAMDDKNYSCQDAAYRNSPIALPAITMQQTFNTNINALRIKLAKAIMGIHF